MAFQIEVLVPFADRGVKGVERVGHRLDSADENVGGKLMIDGRPQAFGRDLHLIGVEVRHLSFGVDARVGSG